MSPTGRGPPEVPLVRIRQCSGVEVVLAEQRQVGLGQPEVRRAVDGQRRLGAGELGLELVGAGSRVLTG